jgi:hypothetical protein
VNKNININKKILKKFLNLLDKGLDIESCLKKFPDEREKLKEYAGIVSSFKNLKDIQVDKDFENKSLKNIYSRARIDYSKNLQRISKKDMLLIRLRPAYLKPLIIFLGAFIFMSFSFGGTLFASGSSLPGDTLYTLKRTSENIHIAVIPQNYKGEFYLKLLDKRLSEAESILGQPDYTNAIAADMLLSDIDYTYKQCRERNSLNANQDSHMQMRIRGIKEGFKNKGGIQKNSSNNCPNQTLEDGLNSTDSSSTSTKGLSLDNSENSSSNTTEHRSPSSSSQQNQTAKQNQFGKK